ncbi:MAG: single-stranded-DNA-specific exonuclease RecJ [bacterium]|nr:single-stranded-DNA-specific exonuclease RecJ [bacterium]
MQKLWCLRSPDICDDWQEFCRLILAHRPALDKNKSLDLAALAAKDVAIDNKQLKATLNRLAQAQAEGQDVVIFGDYDVDGNCATAILWHGLREIGLTAVPFIPHRLRHGYGMRQNALAEIFANSKPDLLITVDNGITANKALEFCKKEAVPVIITDHHLPLMKNNEPVLPDALAVVATTRLCGAGVAWFVVKELWRKLGVKDWQTKILDLLDLVCLATIADQVPLTGVNRQLVKEGLLKLQHSQRPGLMELIKISNINPDKLSVDDIGFGLGPKINAIGRLTNTLEALRLLCTSNRKKAAELAQVLTRVNGQRQELTTEMMDLAIKQIDEKKLDKIIVVSSDKFHEGIIGLIASKLVEIYQRPAIAISLNEKIGKASCRSIEGINITELLRTFREELIDVGGHEMAAGFSFQIDNFATVKKKISQVAKKITSDQLQPKLEGDLAVKIPLLYNPDLPQFLADLAPFGTANPAVIVQVSGRVSSWRFLGTENQHLRLDLVDESGRSISALFWQYAKKQLQIPKRGEEAKILGEIKIDEFRGQLTPKIFALDFKLNHPQ